MRTLFHARAFWYHHQARSRFPLPTTEKWGEGQGEGILKERDNSMERAPLPSPLPARASNGERAGDFSNGGYIKMRPFHARASGRPHRFWTVDSAVAR